MNPTEHKKRVLLVNKFYYPRGGDCIAVLATEHLLMDRGHETALFCMNYSENLPSQWSGYFPDEISFAGGGVAGKMKAAARLFRDNDVAKRFERIMNDFRPDVVHLHNIHSYLSPVVAQIAADKGVRVVWTMHDYKLLCPSYSCLRNGKPCELCLTDISNVFRKRCMKNSRAASLLAWMEASFWTKKRLARLTDTFISPSSFLKNKMIAAGFQPEQISVLPNFMHAPALMDEDREDYYCYAGRLSEEKGVKSLLDAAKQIPYTLKVIGGGALLDKYRKEYPQTHIEFLGQMPHRELLQILRKAQFSVLPSVCYENNPLGIIESLSMGVPVLGSRIGGIPEMIEEGVNGELFTPGDVDELKSKIKECFLRYPNSGRHSMIAATAQEKYSPDNFYTLLTRIYDKQNT
jgi:glycosyltransferase involved in cell wall biosynthesis